MMFDVLVIRCDSISIYCHVSMAVDAMNSDGHRSAMTCSADFDAMTVRCAIRADEKIDRQAHALIPPIFTNENEDATGGSFSKKSIKHRI